MKATVKMTLDGLVRALRARAHDLADEAEQEYRSNPRRSAGKADAQAMRPKLSMELPDDRTRR